MLVIIPVKDLDSCKSRLAHALPIEARQSLMTALLSDLLIMLQRCQSVSRVVVVTRSSAVAALAATHHTETLNLEQDRSLNSGITAAIAALTAQQIPAAMILHGDLPLATPHDLDTTIHAHNSNNNNSDSNSNTAVTLVPDAQQNGTNVMVLNLPTRMQFFYGAHSYQAHLQHCQQHGISVQTVYNEHLGSDIDLWQDFAPLLSLRTAGTRPHLSHWLEQYGELFDWPIATTLCQHG